MIQSLFLPRELFEPLFDERAAVPPQPAPTHLPAALRGQSQVDLYLPIETPKPLARPLVLPRGALLERATW